MKFLDALPGVLVVVLRLSLVAPSRWVADWLTVLAILWITLVTTRENSTVRAWAVAAAAVWLATIYAFHQGVWTFASWN